MSRIFLDTNFLAYMYDEGEAAKQANAIALMTQFASMADVPVISTQVLLELFNTLTRKMKLSNPAADAELQLLSPIETILITRDMVVAAVRLTQSSSISIWDALIVVAAQTAHCAELWTEDMQDGRKFGAVEIVNPFQRR